jgi:hypothetical protein
LGISGVGFWVTLSFGLILWALPASWLLTQPDSRSREVAQLAAIILIYIVLSFPFDWLGGYSLPRRFGRSAPTSGAYLASWLRGVLGQGAIFLLAGVSLLAAGRAGGRLGAIVVAALLMMLLLAAQGWLARLIGGLVAVPANLEKYQRRLLTWATRMPAIQVVRASDPAFVGGLIGLPGREQLVLPAAWCETFEGKADGLSPEATALQIVRRIGTLERGSRRRGVLLALVWNLSGFALASFLPGAGVTTVAELVTTAFGFTLWSFAGLLILPSFSRPAVLEADQFALQQGFPRQLLEQTMTTLDKAQDDEPERKNWLETIFHPVPSVNNRLQNLAQSGTPRGAWQAARTALFLSWGCWGLLGRAVHCNSGRPELWVLFPGD